MRPDPLSAPLASLGALLTSSVMVALSAALVVASLTVAEPNGLIVAPPVVLSLEAMPAIIGAAVVPGLLGAVAGVSLRLVVVAACRPAWFATSRAMLVLVAAVPATGVKTRFCSSAVSAAGLVAARV